MSFTSFVKPIVTATLVVIAYGLPTCAEPSSNRLSDNQILEAIQRVIHSDDVVPSHLIDVRVNDGIVSLLGRTDTLLSKRRTVTLAESVRGVRSVIDLLDVKTVVADDASILKNVREALEDQPAVEVDQIKVGVDDGHVMLEGTVDSYAEAQLAHEAVLGLRGILSLKNGITVQPRTEREDSEIKADVEGRLANDPWLADQPIVVQVDDAQVKLSGHVGSVAEKSIAYRLAWVSGVKFVDTVDVEVERWLKKTLRRDGKVVLRNDVQIKKAIEDAFLYDPRLRSNRVDVNVQQGVVSLSGKVPTLAASRAAQRDANNTMGVRRVRNYVKVQRDQWPGDQVIREKVRKSLERDAHVGMLDIDADSRGGKLYLLGVVQSQFESRRAELLAANVTGVLEVVNRLTVDYTWTNKPDWELKEDVESQFFWSPFVDGDAVTVRVNDGIVTLSGSVDSNQERGAAQDNAEQAGARRVVNQLTVSDNS